MFPFDIFPVRIKISSPETIFIFLPVLFLELFGMILALIGVVDDLGILDTTFAIIVWPWLALKGTSSRPNRKNGFVMKRAVKRQLICGLVELLPIIGTILPLWSYSVYIVLKEEIISDEEDEKEKNMLKKLGQQSSGLNRAGKKLIKK